MAIRNDRELVIEASKAPVDNVYFLGPYGARVSFASQQRRALNLIWALRETKNLWPSAKQPRAAVIGGGIAGVMVAAALRLQGCSVWIYETESSLLSLQGGATHRYVHPSINFWPEQPLVWTTKFPFFDWYATSCDEIIRTIKLQWEAHFRKKIAQIATNTTFTGFSPGRGKDKGKVRLRFKKGASETADLVFITTGFGLERALGDPKYKSYWEVDKLEDMSQDIDKTYVVSGTGDGGLIDTLRLTYTGFMERELALQFLNAIDCQDLRDIVTEIEQVAETKAPEARAEYYHERYTEVARNQDQGAKDLLLPLIDRKNPIRLIGQHARPYEISSAPIHKIILALSIDLGRVSFTQGSVRRVRGKYWLDRAGSASEQIVADRVIVRHGTVVPIVKLVPEDVRANLEKLQRQLGDYLDIGEYKESKYFDMTVVTPGRTHDATSFVESRALLAQDFLRERFDIGVRMPLGMAASGFELVDDRSREQIDRQMFGPVPDQVFGIPLLSTGGRSGPMDDLVGTADR